MNIEHEHILSDGVNIFEYIILVPMTTINTKLIDVSEVTKGNSKSMSPVFAIKWAAWNKRLYLYVCLFF